MIAFNYNSQDCNFFPKDRILTLMIKCNSSTGHEREEQGKDPEVGRELRMVESTLLLALLEGHKDSDNEGGESSGRPRCHADSEGEVGVDANVDAVAPTTLEEHRRTDAEY